MKRLALKAIYALSLTLVFTSGRLPESLVFASMLFIFLMISEQKNESTPQKPNLWFSGVFFILITATAVHAVVHQLNAPIVIIAYVVLIAVLSYDTFKQQPHKKSVRS